VTEIPDLRNKDERWLTSFTEEAVLARNEQNIAAAEEEWRRRDRPDVVASIREQFGPAPWGNSK
jgi:hypothetical protein